MILKTFISGINHFFLILLLTCFVGWETKRSRVPNHKDWVTVRLGDKGRLREAEVDTAHFKGNFPDSVVLEATLSLEDLPSENTEWTEILPKIKLGPHKQHRFELDHCDRVFSHVRITIYPGK